MSADNRSRWLAVARYLLAALIFGSLTQWAESRFSRPEVEGQELLYFPNGAFLREACLGYEQAAAALTWLQAIQYYGGHARSDYDFRHMHHLCDVVTDLDPQFEEPYIFGSYVMVTELSEPAPALALMHKARQNNPDSWRMHFESGIISYLANRDRSLSAPHFLKAARFPDAPEYTVRFAAFMSEERGNLEQALVMWRVVAESAKVTEVRERAEAKIAELEEELRRRREGENDS